MKGEAIEALRIEKAKRKSKRLTRGQATCIRCGRPERSAKYDPDVEIICAKCAMYLADHCVSEGRRLIPCHELRDALRLGKLNSFRNRHGLTWNYLSKQTGMSVSMLRYWARGGFPPTQAERNEIISNIQGHLKPEDRRTYL